MALGRKNQEQITPVTQEKELKQPGAHTCITCQGRGIRPEVSDSELCPDCHGSGTIRE